VKESEVDVNSSSMYMKSRVWHTVAVVREWVGADMGVNDACVGREI
jgi:hypothetical protein